MEESEWRTTDDICQALSFLGAEGWITCRQVQLFRAACCRQLWDLLLDERCRRAVEALEAYAEGELDIPTLREQALEAEDGAAAHEAQYDECHQELCQSEQQTYDWYYWQEQRQRAHHCIRAANLVAHAGELPYIDGVRHEIEKTTKVMYLYLYALADQHIQRHGYSRVTLEWRNGESIMDTATRIERRELCAILREIVGNPYDPMPEAPVWRTGTVCRLVREIVSQRAFDRMPELGDMLADAGFEESLVLLHCVHTDHVLGCWLLDGLLGRR